MYVDGKQKSTIQINTSDNGSLSLLTINEKKIFFHSALGSDNLTYQQEIRILHITKLYFFCNINNKCETQPTEGHFIFSKEKLPQLLKLV